MATANTDPIFSHVGNFQSGGTFTTAAADYLGQNINNNVIFTADATNGSFVQRIRLKALGTNVASVLRLYINNGLLRLASVISPVSGTPTGTPSASGGTLQAGNFFAKIVAIDAYGGQTAASTETASVAVTGTTGSIAWAWTAVTGAVSYKIYVGPVTGGQASYFTSSTNSFTQITTIGQRDSLNGSTLNNFFWGEVSLPATTAIATAATVDIEYPLNFALPPGYRLIGGLGTTVAAGWHVTVIGGDY
jgi:hypothetical protein